jgi:ATP-dependent RNA helicase RhlE
MFSTTMPASLSQMAGEVLVSPTRVEIAGPTRKADGITQSVVTVRRDLKSALVEHLLGRAAAMKSVVFSRSTRGADRLAATLRRSGLEVAALHGDRSESQREQTLLDFRHGRVTTLIATDLASRGLDVQDVTHVINFDVPRAAQDYVHRIGRTGRMHADGEAITLVCAEDRNYLLGIERALGRMIPRMTVKGFDSEAPLIVAASHGSSREAQQAVPESGDPAAPRPATVRNEDTPRSHRARSTARTKPAATPVAASEVPAHGRRQRTTALGRRSRKGT